jgi:PAS domain S-box-containing protein
MIKTPRRSSQTSPKTVLGGSAASSIGFRVVSLVALVLLPLIGLLAWAAVEIAQAKRHTIELHRFEITHRITAAVDAEIARVAGMLAGLAGYREFSETNLGAFSQQARDLASVTVASRIWALGADGMAIAGSSSAEAPGPIPSLARELLAQLAAGTVVVSNVRGSGHSSAAIVVAVPTRHGNKLVLGVAAEVAAARVNEVIAAIPLDPEWVAAVVDRNGRFVARTLDASTYLGLPARPELGAAARGPEPSGTFENHTYEGVHMLNAYRRSTLTDWTSIVAVPSATLAAPFRRSVMLVLLGGSVIIFLTLAGAMYMARRIAEPVRDLSRYTTALATGSVAPEPRYHIAELDEVRRTLEQTMAQSAHLSALVASSGDAIMSMEIDGTIRSWNKGAEALFGYTAEEIVGRPKTLIVPEDRLVELQEQRAALLKGESVRTETTRLRRDGTEVDVSIDSAPIRRPDGTIIALSSIMHDITERKATEEHLRFLMRELSHRSKNQLAIIQSIATQTARASGTLPQFLESFRSRLQGLAASHDVLTAQSWRSAPMRELVDRHVQVFAEAGGRRVAIDGPPISVGAAAAEAIGLALHELGTNSAKYGALSVPSGNVSIAWQVSTEPANGTELLLTWKEADGPAVEEPTQRGFGSMVIEQMVARAVSGTSRIEYLPDGLRWSLRCPLSPRTGIERADSA